MRHLSLFVLLSLVLACWAQDGSIITVNLENDAVQRYLSEVHYAREDTSRVKDYNVAPPTYRDRPTPARVPIPAADAADLLLTYADDADYSEGVQTMALQQGSREAVIYNLTPQRTYYYQVTAGGQTLSKGEIHTEGQVRMIYVPGATNIRDIGGWPTSDGRRIKYGKIFRGSELNGLHDVAPEHLAILTDQLGIQAEMDLRTWSDSAHNISAFGFQSNSSGTSQYPPYYYTYGSGQLPEHLMLRAYRYRWKWEFTFMYNNLRRDRNVYYHCVWGADRSGYLSLFIEGLLGVDYDHLIKDYELSTMYSGSRVKERIDPVLDFIMALEGETLQEKFNTFFVDSLGVYQSYINYFRDEMLEEVKSDTGSGGDNPATDIRSAGRHECPSGSAVTYDLQGRKTRKNGRRRLVIENGALTIEH